MSVHRIFLRETNQILQAYAGAFAVISHVMDGWMVRKQTAWLLVCTKYAHATEIGGWIVALETNFTPFAADTIRETHIWTQ